jgi:hypothetical protein
VCERKLEGFEMKNDKMLLKLLKITIMTMFLVYFAVTRLMGGSAGGSMGHAMTNMSGLTACNVSDSKPMQFPLTQRRKRRVLFTQAQVSILQENNKILFIIHNLCLVLIFLECLTRSMNPINIDQPFKKSRNKKRRQKIVLKKICLLIECHRRVKLVVHKKILISSSI